MQSEKDIAFRIIDRILGTPEGLWAAIDSMIDEGDFTQQEFDLQEFGVMPIIDEAMFECETCGWNVGRGDESDTPSICHDCYQE